MKRLTHLISLSGSMDSDREAGDGCLERGRLLWLRVAVSFVAGIASGWMAWKLPNAITLHQVQVGDIGPPLVGLEQALKGLSPYGIRLVSGPLAVYPFTTMIVLAPLLIFPVSWVAPIFCAVSGAVLAWALTSDGRWWRLMIFVSAPYVIALYAVQWSPLFVAALTLPGLLFLAVVKPQLGAVLLVSGRWRASAVIAAVVVVVLSFLVRPTWVAEWLEAGALDHYQGRIPLLIAPGFLLVTSLALVKTRAGRILAAMMLIPQRFWYDQLLLFCVPATWRQMMGLVVTSWVGLWSAVSLGWNPGSGSQEIWVWRIVVASVYLPALVIVWFQWASNRTRPDPAESPTGNAVE